MAINQKKALKQKIASLKERRAKVLSSMDWRDKDNTFDLQYIKDIDKEIANHQRWLTNLK